MKPIFQEHSCLSEKDIQSYLKDSLSPAERHRVENHMLDCPFCDEAVEGYLLSEQADKKNSEANGKVRRLSLPLRVAAAVVLLIGATWFLTTLQPTPPSDLFSDVYQAYPSDMDVNFRGEGGETAGELTAFEKAMDLYESASFETAIPLYEEALGKGDTQEMVVRFYLGISLLETDQPDRAARQFEQVIDAGKTYSEESQWYLALTHLKQADLPDTRTLLEEILEQGTSHRYYEEAQKLDKQI